MEVDTDNISLLAAHIRNTHRINYSTSNVFSISTSILESLLSSFETLEDRPTTSIYSRKESGHKAELARDAHYLHGFVQQVKAVKLYLDNNVHAAPLDISKFKSLLSLEFSKVDVNTVKGIQKLRPQLQKLACHQTLNTLGEVLSRCGGDSSRSNCWNELKEICFTNNEVSELDRCLECVPWLHTLDLSHNLITNIDDVSCLVNLKHLNLSYNKLEAVPQFKGQICSRLQSLIFKNNFIEDITGLESLTNMGVLDLSNNCLVDHKSLSSISHSATLQLLNLENNPLSFHPHHRLKTASYLHANTATTHFVLDHASLTKSEKKVIGTLHPMQLKSLSRVASDCFNPSSDRGRKIRQVSIEEEGGAKQRRVPMATPISSQHLQTKRQIESLREQYGDAWLKLNSGVLVQNVLGLESTSLPMSSSPYEVDFLLHSGDFRQGQDVKDDAKNQSDASFVTALDTTVEPTPNADIYGSTPSNPHSASDVSDDDAALEGEENIYMVAPKDESSHILIVITDTHIVERECSSNEERARWHVRSITHCERIEEDPCTVQIDFDTMRKDRKRRTYVFEDDGDDFVAVINRRIESRSAEKVKSVLYQCMKCSANFPKRKSRSILNEPVLKCPVCDSTLILEM